MDRFAQRRIDESVGSGEQGGTGISDSAFGIGGEFMITAAKYLEITNVKWVGKFRLSLDFNDGASKEVDLSKLLAFPPPFFDLLLMKGHSQECLLTPSAEFVGSVAPICQQNTSTLYKLFYHRVGILCFPNGPIAGLLWVLPWYLLNVFFGMK